MKTYQTSQLQLGGVWRNLLVVTSDTSIEWGDQTEIVNEMQAEDGSIRVIYYTDGLYRFEKEGDKYHYWFLYKTSRMLEDDARIAKLEAQIQELVGDEPADDRERKLREIGKACTAAITGGVDVETDQGAEHFSLTEEDQINIQNLLLQIQSGQTAVPYHADGKVCRPFTAEEVMALATAATAHKTYHLTYCNHLNVWIRREEDAGVLAGIVYGCELPEDLAENMRGLLGEGA